MKMRKGISWGLIIAAVSAGHVVWWVFLPLELPERSVYAPRPALRYLAIQQDLDGQAEDLWTPTLFAYPFKAGFSKPLLKKEAGSVPPLQVVHDLSVSLSRPVEATPLPVLVKTPSLLPEVEARLADFAIVLEVAEGKAELSLPPLVLNMEVSPPDVLLRDHPLPEVLAGITNLPWEAECRVDFLDNGFVERTYIEVNLQDEHLRTAVLAWVHGLRLVEAQPGVKAHLTVSHIVPYREPRSSAGAEAVPREKN
jgi:hypothetical protein